MRQACTLFHKALFCVITVLPILGASNTYSSTSERVHVAFLDSMVTLSSQKTSLGLNGIECSNPGLDSLLQCFQIDSVRYLFPDAALAVGIWAEPGPTGEPKPDLGDFFEVFCQSTSDRDSLRLALLGRDETVWADTPLVAEINSANIDSTNDTYFNEQWTLRNTGQGGGQQGADIGAPGAWQYTTGSSDLIIAIIDLGVNKTHEDLKDQNNVTRVVGSPQATQESTHGTHVAGFLGATGNNAVGIAGVTWSTRILSAEVANQYLQIDLVKATNAIVEAVDSGAAVINCSWSATSLPQYLRLALTYAANSNVTLVSSIGTPSETPGTKYPSGFSPVIAVGGIRSDLNRASISDTAAYLDLMAPSSDHGQTGVALLRGLSYSDNQYVQVLGTSYAAAYVSGAAALLRSFSSDLTSDDISQILTISAVDLGDPGFDPYTGFGLMKVDSAMTLLQTPYVLAKDTLTDFTVYSTSSEYPVVVEPYNTAYFVKRYELRRELTFGTQYFDFKGAWCCASASNGRSVETTDLHFAELVPGTMTSTGATVRTYVYELWDLYGGHVGYWPTTPANVAVPCTILGEELLVSPSVGYRHVLGGFEGVYWSDTTQSDEWYILEEWTSDTGVWDTVLVDSGVSGDEGTWQFVNVDTSTTTYAFRVSVGNRHQTPPPGPVLLWVAGCDCPFQGDFNSDASLDANDLNDLIDILFFDASDIQDPSCSRTRADINSDGVPDALDLGALIDHLFFGGAGPSDPCS